MMMIIIIVKNKVITIISRIVIMTMKRTWQSHNHNDGDHQDYHTDRHHVDDDHHYQEHGDCFHYLDYDHYDEGLVIVIKIRIMIIL